MTINTLCPMAIRYAVINISQNVQIQSCLRRNITSLSASKANTTVDKEDVERHGKHMNAWWDPKGKLGILHSFNMLRVPLVRDGLVSEPEKEKTLTPLANKTILDVGCGGGILSEALARIGGIVTGVDASKDLIECAKQHSDLDEKIAHNKPTYFCSTIEDHAEEYSNHYDAVVASEIIEHVADKELFVQACVTCLKPGGRIFVTTPNRSPRTRLLGIYVAEYVMGAVPKGTHQYHKLTTPNEVSFLLERNSCHVELIHGMMYNPFSKKWSWVDSTKLMFAMQAIKLETEHK
ncbi:ubiquinone biosynthesis O-methyltransferase, mitochondrial-like isoform X5 [Pieris napi]|uniref:ubiquinone biosynthesis O-methyltransferase, mitochondrial-like isoform X5 n=1 Tax=Pieris napi TaxID=78633 RepID=UPI001FBA11CB|nr:ubiquinone biosynthesis O-methyltransferase, mitochondrial-like isoform X5 [Pieris napi]